MSNTEKVTDILGHMNNKAKIFSVLAIIATTECIVRLGVYLIYFLIFEYFCVLTWVWGEEKKSSAGRNWGIISIILMIVVELTIIYLYYHKDIENIQRTGRINHEIQIACYLGMAMIQYLVFIGREILRISSGIPKGISIYTGAKSGDRYCLAVHLYCKCRIQEQPCHDTFSIHCGDID